MDRFELEGVTYYQQGRKCSKPGCKCSDGKLHGPYWYSRNHTTGKVKYLGRELPEALGAARAAHDTLLPDMSTDRRALIRQADALARLIRNRPLIEGDRDIITALGYEAALVSPAGSAGTQD